MSKRKEALRKAGFIVEKQEKTKDILDILGSETQFIERFVLSGKYKTVSMDKYNPSVQKELLERIKYVMIGFFKEKEVEFQKELDDVLTFKEEK
jgi:hypothetical protein